MTTFIEYALSSYRCIYGSSEVDFPFSSELTDGEVIDGATVSYYDNEDSSGDKPRRASEDEEFDPTIWRTTVTHADFEMTVERFEDGGEKHTCCFFSGKCIAADAWLRRNFAEQWAEDLNYLRSSMEDENEDGELWDEEEVAA